VLTLMKGHTRITGARIMARYLRRIAYFALTIGIFSIPLIAAVDPIAQAANQAKTKTGTSQTEATTFAKQAAIGDMFEVESSKLAAQKAANANVKQFAQEMIEAHTKTTVQLKSIAEKEGFATELPKEMDKKHTKMLSDLQGLSGARFDRKYLELQVAAHREAATLFDSYAAKGKNGALKQFAADTVTTIKQHLDHAQMIAKGTPTS
jgi:putative membrane protein